MNEKTITILMDKFNAYQELVRAVVEHLDGTHHEGDEPGCSNCNLFLALRRVEESDHI